ncbi:MAG: hypothetical protein V5A27_13155 [Halapricum sp.]
MNELGEESRIPILNAEEGDIGVLLGFPLAGIFVGNSIGLGFLVLPLAAFGFALGTAVVYARPSELTAWSWLNDVFRFYVKRPRLTHSRSPESDQSTTEGGLVQYTPFTVDECTQDLTNVERAWAGAGAVERTDGTMEAFLELQPGNMDFAMSGDWQAIQETGQEFTNTELDFRLTFHATTRPFPVERLVERMEDRLTDTDVRNNEVFRDLIEEYREQRPTELAESNRIHYYLGVEVDRFEVYNRFDREKTPSERLTEFPVLGFLFNPFITRKEDLTEPEFREAMFDVLDARLRRVESEFTEKITGWSTRRLTTVELFTLCVEYWNGAKLDPEQVETLLDETPGKGHHPRENHS